MKINKINNLIGLAFALVFTFVLAGCGGGSSSRGSGGSGDATLQNTLAGNIGNAFSDARSQSGTAAIATPKQGSVTQSSDVDSNNITLDQVEATASYNGGDLNVSVTNRQAGAWGTISTEDILLRSNLLEGTSTGTSYQQRTLGKRIGNGAALIDVFTNRLNTTDTDYLVGGVWLLVPDFDTPTGLEIGAFVDGPTDRLTPTTYLQTLATAQYQGDATGLFLESGTTEHIGEFVADVTLTADFKSIDPSIRGEVTDFMEIDASRTELFPVSSNPTLILQSTNIGTMTAGGFFTGDTGGTHTTGGTTYNYLGKWGGQFYGEEANYTGGTFGGETKGNPDGYGLVFVGAFGAYKQ